MKDTGIVVLIVAAAAVVLYLLFHKSTVTSSAASLGIPMGGAYSNGLTPQYGTGTQVAQILSSSGTFLSGLKNLFGGGSQLPTIPPGAVYGPAAPSYVPDTTATDPYLYL